jgi:hypothetical protein
MREIGPIFDQRYHVLSAAALNNSRKRNLFTGKIMAAWYRVRSMPEKQI